MIARAHRGKPDSNIPCLDKPPAGWFALSVMKAGNGRKWDWVALMIDVPPDDFIDRHPLALRPQQCWVTIPGKHRDLDAAWEALEAMTATRH